MEQVQTSKKMWKYQQQAVSLMAMWGWLQTESVPKGCHVQMPDLNMAAWDKKHFSLFLLIVSLHNNCTGAGFFLNSPVQIFKKLKVG